MTITMLTHLQMYMYEGAEVELYINVQARTSMYETGHMNLYIRVTSAPSYTCQGLGKSLSLMHKW